MVSRTASTDKHSGYLYQLWDAGKIQGCKCDLGYEGADCAMREVPRGDDPLTTVKAEVQQQAIQLGVIKGAEQFFLRFYDQYGGTWVTNTITVSGDAADTQGTADHDAEIAADVQYQLQNLPNGVLSDVTVVANEAANNKICHRYHDGVQHISAYDETTDGNYKNSKGTTNFCEGYDAAAFAKGDTVVDLLVTFGNVAGQTGVQYLLEVDTVAQGAGAYPLSLGSAAGTVTVGEVNYNDNLGNLSELATCSDRGLDDGEGQCECFEGYRGLACEEQEALV